jgi:hypothetical protein
MIVYALMMLILIVIYPLFRTKVVLVHGKTIKVNNWIYIYIASFMLIAVAGLRGISVGIDTFQYENTYDRIKLLSFSELFVAGPVEHGYRLLQYTIDQLFGDFQILLIFVAILYVGMVSRLIYKYSNSPLMSYILFIGFGFYTFGMSAIRQTIAMAIIIIAFEYMKEKSFRKFLISTLLASTFHVTALIFLPCYWFVKFKLNKKIILLLIVVAIVLFGLQDEIRGILNIYARLEYSAVETGGFGMYFFIVFSVILGIVYRVPFIKENDYNKYFLYMMIASAMILPITQFNPVVMRLYFYNFIFMIIYIPNVLSVIHNRIIRFIGISAYSLTSIIWFFYEVIRVSELENYRFFWQ